MLTLNPAFMFFNIFTIGGFSLPTISLFIFFGFILFLFLYWRGAKHEFVDEEIVFDTLVICTISALFSARVFEFITHPVVYKWSPANFFFLNPISGLNFWGALFGAIFAGMIYLRAKKYNFWQIFDLAAAPLSLFLAIYNLGLFLGSENVSFGFGFFKNLPHQLFNAILYFVLFWVLKRLEKQKRHVGFFASIFLVVFALVSLSTFYLGKIGILTSVGQAAFLGIVPYDEIFACAFLLFGLVSWYILAKRKPKEDVKGSLALFLLILFRAKRVVGNISEADQIARVIVLLPFHFAKLILRFLQVIAKEIIAGFVDFAHALGFKK